MRTAQITAVPRRIAAVAVVATAVLLAGAPAHAKQRPWHVAAPAAPHVHPHAKAPKRSRARHRLRARSSALMSTGAAYCQPGKIQLEAPPFNASPRAFDYVRWRAVLYQWLGTAWSGPSYGAWSSWVGVDNLFGFDPPMMQVAARSGRYWHVKYQAEHYYSGLTYLDSNVSHFSAPGYGVGTGTYCYVP